MKRFVLTILLLTLSVRLVHACDCSSMAVYGVEAGIARAASVCVGNETSAAAKLEVPMAHRTLMDAYMTTCQLSLASSTGCELANTFAVGQVAKSALYMLGGTGGCVGYH